MPWQELWSKMLRIARWVFACLQLTRHWQPYSSSSSSYHGRDSNVLSGDDFDVCGLLPKESLWRTWIRPQPWVCSYIYSACWPSTELNKHGRDRCPWDWRDCCSKTQQLWCWLLSLNAWQSLKSHEPGRDWSDHHQPAVGQGRLCNQIQAYVWIKKHGSKDDSHQGNLRSRRINSTSAVVHHDRVRFAWA